MLIQLKENRRIKYHLLRAKNTLYIFFLFILCGCSEPPDAFAIDKATQHPLAMVILEKDDSLKLKQLIDDGIDINAKDPGGNTLLLNAAYHNASKCAQLLIAEDATIDAVCFGGNTPLIMACTNRAVEVAKILIDAGADVNAKSSHGNCPLGCAVLSCKYDTLCSKSEVLVKLLIDKGANVNSETSLGIKPLNYAREPGLQKIEALLIQHGAVEGK